MTRTVGLVVCAAGGALEATGGLVAPLVAAGHRVAVTLTPTAAPWFSPSDLDSLARFTGLPVRWQPRLPHERSPHPRIDCYVVAPATAHIVAKLATGAADTQALTQVSEALGTATPVVVFPRVNAAHTRHPAWEENTARLRRAGVRLVEGPEVWPLHEPRQGPPTRSLPWSHILAAVEDALRAAPAL
ncbi:MAG: hypothetical protein QG597_774 [Actinomycetota bacterium]|nr:hypothetical protein [Actinomycetota bacterium]